jgi:hypothetical protein
MRRFLAIWMFITRTVRKDIHSDLFNDMLADRLVSWPVYPLTILCNNKNKIV